jgi:hypothetical protein
LPQPLALFSNLSSRLVILSMPLRKLAAFAAIALRAPLSRPNLSLSSAFSFASRSFARLRSWNRDATFPGYSDASLVRDAYSARVVLALSLDRSSARATSAAADSRLRRYGGDERKAGRGR